MPQQMHGQLLLQLSVRALSAQVVRGNQLHAACALRRQSFACSCSCWSIALLQASVLHFCRLTAFELADSSGEQHPIQSLDYNSTELFVSGATIHCLLA